MSEAPPRPVQVRFIQSLQRDVASTRDLWQHAVSKHWVAALQRFLQADEDEGVSIPPLTASRRDKQDDNWYVGEQNWSILASWYGVDKSYLFRRRPALSSYVSISGVEGTSSASQQIEEHVILTDNKLDFVDAHCCLLQNLYDTEKQSSINIYLWESLDYVEFQLRCCLRIDPVKKVRFWLSFCDDGMPVVLENLDTNNSNGISVGTIICQKIPEVVEALQNRQVLPSREMLHSHGGGKGVKEDLSFIFDLQQWRLTLCLEVIPASRPGLDAPQQQTPIPKALENVSIHHLFLPETHTGRDWEEAMNQILDDSASSFHALVDDQRNKLQQRTEHLLKAARDDYLAKEKQLQAKLAEIKVKEARLDTQDKELNERDHELNNKVAKFKSMLTEFLMNKEKFEKEGALMAEQNALTACRVEVNVGGVRYTTSVSTLVKEAGSTLQVMFSGQHPLTPDNDGSYFIDRDGTHFRHILNYLRDGSASLQHLTPADLGLLSELRAEAEHYKLHAMVDALRIKMAEGRAGGDFVSLPT